MALGINTETANFEDLVPIVKFDARAGRFSRVDRQNINGEWSAETVDITAKFKAVFDLENIEVGWMNFNTGGAPDFRLVALGSDSGPRPSDQHKEGFRVMMKLGKECGGDIRELCSVAKVAIGALDALHDAYLAGAKANAGKLPVVVVKETKPITTGSGAKKSTNYAPVFEIVQWVTRPVDLVFKPKSRSAANGGNGHDAPKGATPPATGSTRAAPPPAAAPAQAEVGDEQDFG